MMSHLLQHFYTTVARPALLPVCYLEYNDAAHTLGKTSELNLGSRRPHEQRATIRKGDPPKPLNSVAKITTPICGIVLLRKAKLYCPC